MSSKETYFVAATIVTSVPTSPRTRSYAARSASGDTGDHALHTARLARPAVRKEESRVAGGAEVDALDLGHAFGPKGQLGGAPEVEVPAAEHARAVQGGERLRHLGPDLVAAWADRRADRGGDRARSQRT